MDEPIYTGKQMDEMMSRARSWTLNSPSGPLPYLPMDTGCAKNNQDLYSTLPPYKKTHWLVRFFMWVRLM